MFRARLARLGAPIFLLALFTQSLTAQGLSTAEIAARAAPATVTILTFDANGDTTGLGSGFLVKPSGVIITNWHVVAGASRAAVRLATGEVYQRVDALDGDERADLAILKVPGFSLPVLTAEASLPAVGSRLVAVGSPLGLSQTVSEGIVSATRLEEGRELLQMTVPISPGSSGGPILNSTGRVVAVATKFLARGQQLNFAVPVRYAMGLVETANVPRPLASVFGATSSENPTLASSSDAVADGSDELPDRTRSPRPSLVGSYRGLQAARFTSRDGTIKRVLDTIQIHLAGEDVGLVIVEASAKRAKSFAGPIQTGSTTTDGRVVLDMGLAPMNGYQTDAGFMAAGTRTRDDGERVEAAFVVERSTPALTATNGIYRLRVQTVLRSRSGPSLGRIEWQGYAAVAVIRDSAFVDLQISNSSGGKTDGFFAGPIKNGRFVASTHSKLPNILDIRFYTGRLQGSWTDQRSEGAYYEGTIEGRRE